MLSPQKNSSSRVLPVDPEHQKHLQKKKQANLSHPRLHKDAKETIRGPICHNFPKQSLYLELQFSNDFGETQQVTLCTSAWVLRTATRGSGGFESRAPVNMWLWVGNWLHSPSLTMTHRIHV